jgi:hypothetical protein
MKTRDSLELTRERLPHLVIVRVDEDVPDLTQSESDDWLSDELSYLDDDEEEVSSVNSDLDYDPFALEIDSLVLTRRRLPNLIHRDKRVVSTSTNCKDYAPHKDLGFDRVGLNDDLLQSARPNSGGAIAA